MEQINQMIQNHYYTFYAPYDTQSSLIHDLRPGLMSDYEKWQKEHDTVFGDTRERIEPKRIYTKIHQL